MDAKLGSNLDQLELQINQTWFRELACWEQLEVRCVGKLEISKNPSKNQCYGRLEMAQDGPKRAPGIILQDFVVPFPFLGLSWAHLGLSWALLGSSWGVQEGILR